MPKDHFSRGVEDIANHWLRCALAFASTRLDSAAPPAPQTNLVLLCQIAFPHAQAYRSFHSPFFLFFFFFHHATLEGSMDPVHCLWTNWNSMRSPSMTRVNTQTARYVTLSTTGTSNRSTLLLRTCLFSSLSWSSKASTPE